MLRHLVQLPQPGRSPRTVVDLRRNNLTVGIGVLVQPRADAAPPAALEVAQRAPDDDAVVERAPRRSAPTEPETERERATRRASGDLAVCLPERK